LRIFLVSKLLNIDCPVEIVSRKLLKEEKKLR